MTDSQTKSDKTYTCPHCGETLKKWQTPDDSTWAGEVRLVCFNDECRYFVRGWEVMMERQQASASYRHLFDPKTGYVGPLPVWSRDALKDAIID